MEIAFTPALYAFKQQPASGLKQSQVSVDMRLHLDHYLNVETLGADGSKP
jgi:hypothetical protein